jgi:hypothetical protein
MNDSPSVEPPTFHGGSDALHLAIGQAIAAYANVEGQQAMLLQLILKVDMRKSHLIFFAVQNTRSRNELFQALLEEEVGVQVRAYWNSCVKYFEKLSRFRNAIAHWHPYVNVYLSKSDPEKTYYSHALGHPVPGRPFKTLTERDFPNFIEDCQYVREELSALSEFLRKKPSIFPERFLKPIARQNRALLQVRPTAKSSQPQRPHSSPKLSPEQQRAKEAKDALQKKTR